MHTSSVYFLLYRQRKLRGGKTLCLQEQNTPMKVTIVSRSADNCGKMMNYILDTVPDENWVSEVRKAAVTCQKLERLQIQQS